MFAGATRTIAAVALAGAMVAGRVRYLHFAAIRGICKVDLCSLVQPPGVGAVVAPSERNFRCLKPKSLTRNT